MAQQVEPEGKSWPPKTCIPKQLLVDPSLSKDLLCELCGGLCLQAMEMTCDEHDGDDSGDNKLFGKQCIEKYLETHSNKCPIGGHPNPEPKKSKYVRGLVSKFMFKCPKSLPKTKEESSTFVCVNRPRVRAFARAFFRAQRTANMKKRSIINRDVCKWTGLLKEIAVSPLFVNPPQPEKPLFTYIL